MANIINVVGLNKSYGKKVVLDNVSFEIEEGSIVGLLGPNGCGKTTLIKILTGLIKDHTGTVKIANEEPGAYTKGLVAFLPDTSYLPDWMKPTDAIEYFADFYEDFDKNKAVRMVTDFGLDPHQKFKTMSKGQQEKLHLILVMCRKADLYILDEPLGGVDVVARDFILETILKNHAENSTILLSTHLIYDIERILDRVLMVKGGMLAVNTDVEKIRENGNTVENLFREVFSNVW